MRPRLETARPQGEIPFEVSLEPWCAHRDEAEAELARNSLDVFSAERPVLEVRDHDDLPARWGRRLESVDSSKQAKPEPVRFSAHHRRRSLSLGNRRFFRSTSERLHARARVDDDGARGPSVP